MITRSNSHHLTGQRQHSCKSLRTGNLQDYNLTFYIGIKALPSQNLVITSRLSSVCAFIKKILFLPLDCVKPRVGVKRCTF